MLKCYLAVLMGQHKLNIADVMRETGLSRSALTSLYDETAKRIDLDTIDKLCRFFDVAVDDLFEYRNSGSK